MRFINKFCALIVILLFVVSDIKAQTSSVPSLNNSNISNDSSKIVSKDSCFCDCPLTECPVINCDANADASSDSCFASDTLVTLTNHKSIPIHQLRSGDELLTTDGTNIFTTQMMMMLDKNNFTQAMFHTIVTASGQRASLTGLHLIPIIENENALNYVPAKEVKVGDVVNIMSDDQVMLSPVIEVIVEMKTGFYAPLTTSGTILVNGIMASCFSNVKSHEAAQWYMSPLRWYYRLAQSLSLSEPFGNQNREGVHFIPQIMYEFGQIFRPSTLRLT